MRWQEEGLRVLHPPTLLGPFLVLNCLCSDYHWAHHLNFTVTFHVPIYMCMRVHMYVVYIFELEGIVVLWLDLSLTCSSQAVLLHVCACVHFSKGLAKKVLRKPPKSCAGVLMSREMLTAMFLGGELGCRKTLIQAHSVAALELKRPTIPGPGVSGSWAERREPAAVASSISWRAAPPWCCFPQSSCPPLSFSPTSSLNRTPKQRVGIHRQVYAGRRMSCSQGREHKRCVSGL